MNFHSLSSEEILAIFPSSKERGLTTEQVQDTLKRVGYNILPQGKKSTLGMMIWGQLNSSLIWILIIAAILSAVLDHSYIDVIVILIIVVLNIVIGVAQEFKTEKTLEHLRSLLTPQARVLREAELCVILATNIVPGDILLLDEWERIVADARLIQSSELQVNQSILTGESMVQEKNTLLLPDNTPLSDRVNMVYQGTAVASGSGKAVVVATGAHTELGHISGMVEQITDEVNPFSRKLEEFSRKIAIFIGVLCVIIVTVLIFSGGKITHSLLVAVSLAVSAIPEWLPAVVALGLALATKRLVKKNVLVRKLPASETLWRVTVICTDKTGTLTKSDMQVVNVYTDKTLYDESSFSWISHRLLEISAGCNKAGYGRDATGAEQLFGDPTDIGLLQFSELLQCKQKDIESQYPVICEFPFDSDRKRMSIVRNHGDFARSYVKWAPERIMELISNELIHDEIVSLTPERKKELYEVFTQYAKDGKRVLAMAYRDLKKNEEWKGMISLEEAETELVFVWFTAIMDPPRPEVGPAITLCQTAGIRVIMITGDSELTAGAVGKIIWLQWETLDATQLSTMDDMQLSEKLTYVSIFSRIAPQDKLRIVRLLKAQWNIVAMTGDGVNDALALKQADIGIAMGIRGTDVARDASDMVLLDDNFASIVSGVEEGRRVYDNTKKFIKYLLACNFYEVFLVALAVLIFHDALIVPFIAIQILWINLVTDSFPALALSTQDIEEDVMQRKPIDEGLLTGIQGFIFISGIIGLVIVGLVFLLFYKEDLQLAQTMAVATSVVYQMFLSLGCWRLWAFNLKVNGWLVGAVLFSLILHFTLLSSPFAINFWFVPLSSLTLYHFSLIFGLSGMGYIVWEISKWKNRI